MGQYINKRQLIFLVVIVLAIYLIRENRSDVPQRDSVSAGIASSLEEPFRQQPFALTPLARCQQMCLSIADSSLSTILKFGVITRTEDTLMLSGNTFSGLKTVISMLNNDQKNLITNITVEDGPRCQCRE